MNDLIFPTGSVPVRVAAKVYGRDPSWVRAGIISGWLPIGTATRDGKKITDLKEMNSKFGRINLLFYFPARKNTPSIMERNNKF